MRPLSMIVEAQATRIIPDAAAAHCDVHDCVLLVYTIRMRAAPRDREDTALLFVGANGDTAHGLGIDHGALLAQFAAEIASRHSTADEMESTERMLVIRVLNGVVCLGVELEAVGDGARQVIDAIREGHVARAQGSADGWMRHVREGLGGWASLLHLLVRQREVVSVAAKSRVRR